MLSLWSVFCGVEMRKKDTTKYYTINFAELSTTYPTTYCSKAAYKMDFETKCLTMYNYPVFNFNEGPLTANITLKFTDVTKLASLIRESM